MFGTQLVSEELKSTYALAELRFIYSIYIIFLIRSKLKGADQTSFGMCKHKMQLHFFDFFFQNFPCSQADNKIILSIMVKALPSNVSNTTINAELISYLAFSKYQPIM